MGGGPPCGCGCAFVARPERVVTMLLVFLLTLTGDWSECLQCGVTRSPVKVHSKHFLFDSYLSINSRGARTLSSCGTAPAATAATLGRVSATPASRRLLCLMFSLRAWWQRPSASR